MTTPVPPSITVPDSVETRIGTLEFFDGVAEEAIVVFYLGLYASAKATLTGCDIETRFVRNLGRNKMEKRWQKGNHFLIQLRISNAVSS